MNSLESLSAVTIREFRIDDYDAIVTLWTKAGLSYRPRGRDSRRRIENEIIKDTTFFLIAELDGKLVGSVLGTHDGRKGWINRLAVLPEHRRMGVAHALIAACEKALKKRGRRIICTLVEDNPQSMELFKKEGYVKHDDIFYMSKREHDDV